MGVTAKRLQQTMDELGWDQQNLASRLGVTQGAISKILVGKTANSRLMPRIAAVTGVPLEWLLGEADTRGAAVPPAAPSTFDADNDVVEIDMIDLSYGMGATFLDSDHVEVEKVKFSNAWLRQFTTSPAHFLASTRGIGDSMWPTIHDRDVVIIDKSQTRLDDAMGDKIWAVSFAGMGMIKRLRAMPDGTVKLSSDNQVIRDEIASDGELYINGRVIAVVRSV